MYLGRLEVENLRVIDSVSLLPDPRLNVIAGLNGAGKTSLLEAIYILGTGRSFRSRRLEALVRRGADDLRVFGEVVKEGEARVGIGIGRGKHGMRVRIAGECVDASSRLAQELSLALVTPESHRLLLGGPRERRRILDWGLFHVEQGYLELLQRYGKAVRQRNAALRGGASSQQLAAWDRELVPLAEALTASREQYVGAFQGALQPVTRDLLGQPVSVAFKRGWSRQESFAEALQRARKRDREEGRTTMGPHRADLEFLMDGVPAADALSRGQAKLFVSGVELAQVKGVVGLGASVPVVLVDDLPSELDEANRGRFLELLRDVGGQVFVTSVDPSWVESDAWDSKTVFHVEQGRAHEVI